MENALWLNRIHIDIVFERRHKDYGAFQLRSYYERNMASAILFSICLFVFALVSFTLWQNRDREAPLNGVFTFDDNPYELSTYKREPKPEEPEPQTAAPKPMQPQQSFLPPSIVDDDIIAPEVENPTQDTLNKTAVGSSTDAGKTDGTGMGEVFKGGTGNGTGDGTGDGTGEVDNQTDPVQLFQVQQKPEFPGGELMMFRYLQKNLRYPQAARELGISGTVILRFVVNREGRIEQVEIVRSTSKLFNEEALRAIRAMPVWRPGIANGKPVPVYFTIPLKFELI